MSNGYLKLSLALSVRNVVRLREVDVVFNLRDRRVTRKRLPFVVFKLG